MNRQTKWPALALVLSLAALVGCSDGGGDTATSPDPGPEPDPAPSPSEDVVTIELTENLTFSPAEVTIDPGTTVRWVDRTTMFHTVTPENPDQPGAWARHEMDESQGQEFEFTFTESDQTYEYFCEPHRADGMTGTIIVRSEPSTTDQGGDGATDSGGGDGTDAGGDDGNAPGAY